MMTVSFLTYHDLHAKMTESSADDHGIGHTITPHNSFTIYGIYTCHLQGVCTGAISGPLWPHSNSL
jgi:hypothetical protein